MTESFVIYPQLDDEFNFPQPVRQQIANAPELEEKYGNYANLARNPDLIIAGAVVRNSDGAAVTAPVIWPDGATGTYAADTLSTAFPGAVDGYHITYAGTNPKTYTQPTITRDSNGAAITVPAITVS